MAESENQEEYQWQRDWDIISIRHSVDRQSEVHLEDGTVLIYKCPVLRVYKHKTKFDQAGRPVYYIETGSLMVDAQSVPGDLMLPRS